MNDLNPSLLHLFQRTSDYFLDSADKIHFFEEPVESADVDVSGDGDGDGDDDGDGNGDVDGDGDGDDDGDGDGDDDGRTHVDVNSGLVNLIMVRK